MQSRVEIPADQFSLAPAEYPFGFWIRGIVGEQRQRRLLDVRLHEGIEQRGLRTERAEDRDFVDVRFRGDESRSRASEAVLGVDAGRCVENSVADFHGRGL